MQCVNWAMSPEKSWILFLLSCSNHSPIHGSMSSDFNLPGSFTLHTCMGAMGLRNTCYNVIIYKLELPHISQCIRGCQSHLAYTWSNWTYIHTWILVMYFCSVCCRGGTGSLGREAWYLYICPGTYLPSHSWGRGGNWSFVTTSPPPPPLSDAADSWCGHTLLVHVGAIGRCLKYEFCMGSGGGGTANIFYKLVLQARYVIPPPQYIIRLGNLPLKVLLWSRPKTLNTKTPSE